MRSWCLARRLILLATFFLLNRYAASADLILADSGKCDYQIVTPDELPSPSITDSIAQTARLMQCAFKANGFDVAVVAEGQRDPNKPAIFLGTTKFASKHRIDVSKLKGWSYVQKVVDKDLVIIGRDQSSPAKSPNPRRQAWDRIGTAKGVVDFLRQHMGTRFLYPELAPNEAIHRASRIDPLTSPAIEFVKLTKIAIPADLNVTITPRIEFNTAHPASGCFYDIAHNRFPLVDTLFGGHTYERAIPREQYAETHPEYFAMIGGRRTAKDPGNAQYCISNPEVRELIFQEMVSSIDRGYECVDIGQPDGFRACQCEACAKLYNTGSDWAEKLWLMNRELAARVQEARPGKTVTMMSYIQTELPPKSFREFPANTRILLTGTNEEDIAPWRNHQVPQGYSSYIYNWCPNLGTRYTPMRTPRYVDEQVRRLTANKIQSVYRDGPGSLYGLEGPVYYTMGRMFDDPENLQAKILVQEFCGAAFGKSAATMLAFYDQLYHGIELYSEHLGTRSPAWTYQDIYGRRRKHLTDPMQFLGFLYTPSLLTNLETQLAVSERNADSEKVKQRLAVVRREFDYLKALAKVVHLYHAFQIQPDLASRDRLLDAIDARNALVDSLFDKKRTNPVPLPGFAFVMFPPIGHDAKHLRLNYDGYQEPFANSVMNWDTQAMRVAPLPGAKRLVIGSATGTMQFDSPAWEKAATHELGSTTATPANYKTRFKMFANDKQLFLRIECDRATDAKLQDSLEVYLEPLRSLEAKSEAASAREIIYRFTVGVDPNSRQDSANGFVSDPLDPRFGRFDPDWNGEWTYESKLDSKSSRWIAFLVIPFKTLGIEASPVGTFWRGNVARVYEAAANQNERSLWAMNASTKTLDDRNSFGEFAFEAPVEKSGGNATPTKPALQELREKLYATSFEIPDDWKRLKNLQQLEPNAWRFRPDPLEIGLKESWQRLTVLSSEWIPLRVPSFWAENESVGKYTGIGWHHTTFQVPAEWKGRRLRVLIGSADEQAWVYLNGHEVREHTTKSEGRSINDLWESPFAAELPSQHVNFSKPNVLMIRVHNSITNGGIWRPVFLHAVSEK